MDGLTSQFVIRANNGSLGNTVVEDKGRLNLSSRETVTRDVDDV